MKKAICLLSGGLDSSVAMAVAKSQGYEIYALTFFYNQKHSREVDSAKQLASYFKVKKHEILEIDLGKLGGSSLTDDKLSIPDEKTFEEIKTKQEIPTTYVPARNIIFLAYGLTYAEVVGAEKIFSGVNAIDYSNYPDCRPEFIERFQEVAEVGTKRGVEGKKVKIETPLLQLSKTEIIKKGQELGVPFELTWSCYKGKEKACGECESCVLRLEGFKGAGLEDPLRYEIQD